MKKQLVISLAAFTMFGGFHPALGQNPEPPTANVKDGSMKAYKLAWADEFDGPALDAKKWDYRTDSRMWSTQKPENVEISDGTLKLWLKKEDAGDKHYTGGGVISKQAFRYGYYEARMKTPPGAGWHTSFWMMLHNGKSNTGPNAACQELDVIENDSIHNNSYAVNVHKWKGEHVAFGTKTVKTPDLSADFHIFGCEFTPITVKYFFDGALVQTTKATYRGGGNPDFDHGDQHIWLTSIASNLGGTKAVDDTALPAIAEFDYVRFFSAKQDTNTQSSAIAIKDGQTLAFLGDSITWGGSGEPYGFVNLVINGLNTSGLKVTPMPAGIKRHTSGKLAGRIGADVIAKNPDWVIIQCGINDVGGGAQPVPTEQFQKNISTMVDQCQAAKIEVMLLTVTMFTEDQNNEKNQKLVAYNESIRTLAKEKHCLLADVNLLMQAAVKLPDGAPVVTPKPNRITGDGIHLNPIGHQIMAGGILRAFGLTDAQLQAAMAKWGDIPNAMTVRGVVKLSLYQVNALEAVARQRNQSISDLANKADAKAWEELLKGAH